MDHNPLQKNTFFHLTAAENRKEKFFFFRAVIFAETMTTKRKKKGLYPEEKHFKTKRIHLHISLHEAFSLRISRSLEQVSFVQHGSHDPA